MSDLTENIKVFVRVRPLTSSDKQKILQVTSDNDISLLSNATAELKYKFNAIFSEHIHQDEAYNVILVPIVRDIIQGYNCTLFSSGLPRSETTNATPANVHLVSSTPILAPTITKTLAPPPDDAMNSLISSAMYRLFEHLTQMELSSTVRISYLEIFDEELFDLLQPNNVSGIQLKIFENDKSAVYVNGLSETTVHSATEAIMILRMAQKNARSTKSHSIFTISVQSKEKPKYQMHENEELFKFRKLCLVQLGSQERQKKQAGARTVQSFTSLSRVVQALINKQSYIPYRDSKLTRIMQESLGGNTKTSIVASIGSGNTSIEEITQAFEFLNRIKFISNHPKINERLDDARSFSEMALEIRKLIMDIDANRNKTGHFLTDDMYVNYQTEMKNTKADSRRHKQELMLVNEVGHDLDCTFSHINANLVNKRKKLTQLQLMASTKQKQLQIISNVTQNRENLIDRFNDNEKTITKQSTEITAAVKEILSDKTNLDDCVERYKSTDEHFMQTVLIFQADMQQKLSNLQKHSNETRDVIDTKLQKIGDLEKSFLRNTNLLAEVIKTKSLALLAQLEVDLTKERNNWDDTNNDFNEAILSYLKSSESNITLYKGFAQELEQQSNTIETAYNELKELYQLHFIAVDKMITNIAERMNGHSVNTSSLLHSMRSSIGKYADMASTIDDKMHMIYEQMRGIVIQVQQNTASIKNSVEPALLTSEMNLNQAKEAIIESLNGQQIAVDKRSTLFTQPQLPEHFKATQIKLKNTLNNKTALMHDSLEKVTINNTTAMEYMQKHIESNAANVTSIRNNIEVSNEIEIIRKVLNIKQTRVSEQYTENTAAFNEIAMNTDQMAKKIIHEITSCHKKIHFFNEMDFCDYKPTGETPAKRDYQTSVSLAATTPLEKIKQRFRDRYSQINCASPNANYSFLGN